MNLITNIYTSFNDYEMLYIQNTHFVINYGSLCDNNLKGI